jgi:glycosyltransferase involved in cell wall biosynthesis
MNIAVDARELTGNPTGVGRYLAELMTRWSEMRDAQRHAWTLYAHRPVASSLPRGASVVVLDGDGGTWWEQWTLARAVARDRADVLFAPGYSAPMTARCPIALTVHDVSFCARPDWFSPREGLRRRTFTAWSARRARVVVTDSAFSRDEIIAHIGVPGQKLRVILPGITPIVAPDAPATREPLILFVGSIFRRRHVDRLIRVFVDDVADRVPDSRLEIVGENRMYPPADPARLLHERPAASRQRVSIRSYVDEQTLRGLYARAAVFAFPSEYEGFGFTPLEALSAGVPSVVLDTPVAREICGPAARYIPTQGDGPDAAALADALVELLTSAPSRASILQHAPDVLSRYDWSRAAAQTLRAIEEAAGV